MSKLAKMNASARRRSMSGGTGRAVRISGFEVWQIGADGLIDNSRGHFDSLDYQRQLAG